MEGQHRNRGHQQPIFKRRIKRVQHVPFASRCGHQWDGPDAWLLYGVEDPLLHDSQGCCDDSRFILCSANDCYLCEGFDGTIPPLYSRIVRSRGNVRLFPDPSFTHTVARSLALVNCEALQHARLCLAAKA